MSERVAPARTSPTQTEETEPLSVKTFWGRLSVVEAQIDEAREILKELREARRARARAPGGNHKRRGLEYNRMPLRPEG